MPQHYSLRINAAAAEIVKRVAQTEHRSAANAASVLINEAMAARRRRQSNPAAPAQDRQGA